MRKCYDKKKSLDLKDSLDRVGSGYRREKKVCKTIKIRKMKELDRLQSGEDSLLSAFALQKCSLPFTHELRRILW